MGKPLYSNTLRCKPKALLLGLLCLCAGFSGAQVHTFAYQYKDWAGSGMVEDDKNGYLLVMGDYITRIDRHGNVLWKNKSYGLYLSAKNVKRPDNFYLFGIAGEAGGFAFNAVDYRGNIKDEVLRFGWAENDTTRTPAHVFYDSNRNQFIVCGYKARYLSIKYQYWIAGFDEHGKMLWENSWYDKGKSRYLIYVAPNAATRGYLLVGHDEDVTDYHEIFTTDSMGRLLTRNFIDTCSPTEKQLEIFDIQPYRDSFFLISAIKSCQSLYSYFLIDKKGKNIKRFDNRYFAHRILPQKNGNIIISIGDELGMLDTNFNLVWKQEKIFGDYPDYSIGIDKIYPSRDGGFYGIANGMGSGGPSRASDVVFVFKTDSLGRIYPKPAYSEWDRPMMLQPNPARGKLRIAIPYYFGNIEAEFYNPQGQLLESQTRNESDYFDISRLSPGIYLVKARNPQTGEHRNMKLVVE